MTFLLHSSTIFFFDCRPFISLRSSSIIAFFVSSFSSFFCTTHPRLLFPLVIAIFLLHSPIFFFLLQCPTTQLQHHHTSTPLITLNTSAIFFNEIPHHFPSMAACSCLSSSLRGGRWIVGPVVLVPTSLLFTVLCILYSHKHTSTSTTSSIQQ